MRQPLYQRDFCRIIRACIEIEKTGTYDIVGDVQIDYVDIIRSIKRAKGLRTLIVNIPYGLFDALLRVYALLDSRPPGRSSRP